MNNSESTTGFKVCRRCKESKSLDFFGANKLSKDKLAYFCKVCACVLSKEYAEKNKELVAAKKAAYRKKNKEKISEYFQLYAIANADQLREKRKEKYYATKEESRPMRQERNRQYWKRNVEAIAERRRLSRSEPSQALNDSIRVKAWYKKNVDSVREKSALYYQANRQRILLMVRAYEKANPEKTKLLGRIKQNKRRANLMLAGGSYTRRDVDRIYGLQRGMCAACSVSLKDGYHIDHRIPVAKGGDNSPSNIELLCPPCNLKKAAKLPHVFAKELGRLL